MQLALAVKQQAEQAMEMSQLQQQLEASKKALDEQKVAAQKLEQVHKYDRQKVDRYILLSLRMYILNQPS